MQGRHILNILVLILLLAAVTITGGCTAKEDIADAQPVSPAPMAPDAQAVGGTGPAPTPNVPPRGANLPQSIEFVDPATYHIPTPTPTIAMAKPPVDIQVSGKLVNYAELTAEYPARVLATEVYHIPFPYWAVNVSATAMNDYPWLVVEIRDPADPNRIVEEIRYSRNDILLPDGNSDEKEEQFIIREGYDDYYFTIRSESLKSFTITIRVPEKYLV